MLVTNIGNGMQMLAVGKLLYDATGSAAAFGGVITLQYLITFLLTFLAGGTVDRFNPKVICAGVDALRGALVCAVSALGMSSHPVSAVIAIMLVIQLGRPFQRSALFALETRMVAPVHLARYNGYSVTCMQVGQLLGVALCGLVLKQGDASLAVFLNGASFMAAAGLTALIRLPRLAGATEPELAPMVRGGLLGDWRSAADLVWQDRPLLALILLGAADYAVVDFINLAIVPIVGVAFSGDPYWLSLLDGAFAIGAMVAGLAVDRIIARLGVPRSIVLGVGAQALLYLALVPMYRSVVVLPVMFGLGVSTTLSSVAVMSALQVRTPRAFQGRLSSMRSLYIAIVSAALVPLVARTMSHGVEMGLLLGGTLAMLFFVFSIVVVRGAARPDRASP